MFHRHLSTSHVEVTVVEAKHDQRRALIDSEAQKFPEVEEFLIEVQCRLHDHSSSAFWFSHDSLRDIVNKALYD